MDERTAQEPSAPNRADRVEIKRDNTHFVPLVIRNNWDYNIIKGTLVGGTTIVPGERCNVGTSITREIVSHSFTNINKKECVFHDHRNLL